MHNRFGTADAPPLPGEQAEKLYDAGNASGKALVVIFIPYV
jgi:hypothetical protein